MIAVFVLLGLAIAFAAYYFSSGGFGLPPISRAASKGDVEGVLELLRTGANPNEPDSNGAPPLQHALIGGSIEVADALCIAGAQVDAKDKKGKTILENLQAAPMPGGSDGQTKRQKAIEWLKKQVDMRSRPRERPRLG